MDDKLLTGTNLNEWAWKELHLFCGVGYISAPAFITKSCTVVHSVLCLREMTQKVVFPVDTSNCTMPLILSRSFTSVSFHPPTFLQSDSRTPSHVIEDHNAVFAYLSQYSSLWMWSRFRVFLCLMQRTKIT